MKPFRYLLLVLLSAFMFSVGTLASEPSGMEAGDWIDTASVTDAVPTEAKDLLGELESITQMDPAGKLKRLLETGAENAVGFLYDGVTSSVRLLLVVVLCQFVDSFSGARCKDAVRCGGAIALCAACLTELRPLIGLGKETLYELTNFTMALNPVMAAAAAASGSDVSAGVNYALTAFFSNLLLQACVHVILPLIYAYLAMTLADTVANGDKLKHLRELMCWLIEILLKGVVYAFIGALTLSGVLTGAVDAAKMKAAKNVIATMIPVVGGIISGAAQTLLTGMELLKNSIGTYGLLAVLAIVLLPFLKLSVNCLLLKITVGVGGLFSGPLAVFLEAAGKSMAYLLGMTGSGALICLLSCCCYIKVVQSV